MKISYFLSFFLLVCCITAMSQKPVRPNTDFGEIKPDDFTPTFYPVDSAAHAVVLFETMKSEYEADSRGGFNIVYKYHKRMRLMNKNAFDEATIEIPISSGGNFEDEIKKMDAATYNLEGGNVVVAKVEKNSIYKDKVTKDFHVKKFTFPALKEGSIVEYKYTIICPHETTLRGWVFQSRKYPILWSEFDYTIPSLYRFLPVQQGLEDFVVNTTETKDQVYHLYSGGATADYNSTNTRRVFALANVPALKEESYVTTVDNYLSKIDFYLLSINYSNQPPRILIQNWYKVADDLLKFERFGAPLSESNGWMKEDLAQAGGNIPDSLEKLKSIFAWVRNHMECTDRYAIFMSESLKKIAQARKGSVADINLLLTAMCRKAGFDAKPVLLSTRAHGRPLEGYPILNQFNYLITLVKLGDKEYCLDASEKTNAFNKLPVRCYNGTGRIIAEEPLLVPLSSDSVFESKVTSVFIMNGEKGGMEGAFTSQLGYYESTGVREKMEKTIEEDFFKDIKKAYSMEIEMSEKGLDSLKNVEYPVGVHYNFKFNPEDDIIYFNPMLTEATKTNPFKSLERLYPVEMPYKISEVYVFKMDIPAGYKVDEIPKSAKVRLNEDEGMFEFIVSNNGKEIQMRSKIVLYKAIFSPEDYETLRNFFDYIVKKHNEQIVFKKIK